MRTDFLIKLKLKQMVHPKKVNLVTYLMIFWELCLSHFDQLFLFEKMKYYKVFYRAPWKQSKFSSKLALQIEFLMHACTRWSFGVNSYKAEEEKLRISGYWRCLRLWSTFCFPNTRKEYYYGYEIHVILFSSCSKFAFVILVQDILKLKQVFS